MKISKLFFLTLLLFSVIGQQTLQQYNKELKIYQKDNYLVKEREDDMFMLIIPQDFDNNTRLAVMTRPNDYRSDPDVFIHDTIQKPTKEQLIVTEKDHFCYHYGPDFCLIPQEYIKPGNTIYITVYIQYGPCNFNMVVQPVSPPTEIEFNKEYEIILQDEDNDFEETIAEYVTIKLPTESEQPNINQMTVAVVRQEHDSAYYMNSLMNKDDLRMQYTVGKDNDPKTANQFLSESLFTLENGMIFQIDEKDMMWKRGETYNFVVTSSDLDHIRLVTFLTNKNDIQYLKFDQYFNIEEFNDIPTLLYSGYTKTYCIKNFDRVHSKKYAQDQKMSTIIQMHETFGDVDLYIDCQNNQIDYENKFLFKTQENGSEMLLISSEELDSTCTDLYITAVAKRDTIYQLEITFRPEDLHHNTLMPIKPYIAEQGYLKSDELASYILELKRDQEQTVTINLRALQGNSDLFIRSCDKNDNCFDFFEEFKGNKNKNDPDNDFMKFTVVANVEGNDFIQFQHNEKTCTQFHNKSEERPYCYYLVMVYNEQFKLDQSINQDLKYELEVMTKKNVRHLRENDVLYDTVELSQYNYYKFDIGNFDNIENIVFVVTPLSGDPNLVSSRAYDKPQYESAEHIASAWFNYIEYKKEELVRLPQNTTFYIGVHGFTESRYTLRVQIERTDSEKVNKAIKLVNGVLMNSFFQIDQEVLYFDFPVSQKNNLVQFSIFEYVKSQTDFKHLKMYGRDLYEQDNDKFYDDTKKYPYQNLYNGVLQIDRDEHQDYDGFIGYRIMVTRPKNVVQKLFISLLAQSLESFTEIIPGQEREFIIYKEQKNDQQQEQVRANMIKFQVDMTQDQEIHLGISSEIYKNLFTAQFFSVKQNALQNLNHNDQHVDIDKKKDKHFLASFTFDRAQLEKLCKGQPEKHCKIYGLLKIFEQQNNVAMDYNIKAKILLLKINKSNNSNLLRLNMNHNVKVPIQSNFLKSQVNYPLYYRVDQMDRPFFIDIQSLGEQQIHVEFRTQMDENYQPPNNTQFISSQTTHYYREFQPQELLDNGCKVNQPCIVLIIVRPQFNKKMLNIQVGQDIMDISDKMNEHIKGRVGKDQYMYYKIHLEDEREYNTISLNMLNGGDANIIAYYHPSDFKYRPIDGKQVCKDAPQGGNCLVSNKDKNDEVSFQPGKQGYYIIGIYGTDLGDNLYSLQWRSTEIQQLQTGVTQKIEAPIDKYSHYYYSAQIEEESETQNLMAVVTSQMAVQDNVQVVVGLCKDSQSNQLSKSKKFCDPNKKETIKLYQKFLLEKLNFEIDLKQLCSELQPGETCNLVVSFKSLVKKDLKFEVLLIEEKENESTILLKPNQYLQHSIKEKQTHKYQILFQNPENQKDSFLNINSISGDLKINVKPESLRIFPVNGQDNLMWIKITKNHFVQNFKNETKHQLNYIEIEVSGCQDPYGCEYGIGMSIEGQNFILTPGLLYSGILGVQKPLYFETFVDRTLNTKKQTYLTVTTFQHWRFNVENLYMEVIIEYNKSKDRQYLEISRGYRSFILPMRTMGNPRISVQLIDRNKEKLKYEVDFSLLVNSGKAQEIPLQYNGKSKMQMVQQKYSQQDPDVYFLNSNQDGSVYLKVLECSGTYKLKTGDTQDILFSKLKNKETANDNDEALLNVVGGKSQYAGIIKDVQLADDGTEIDPKEEVKIVGYYGLQSYFFKEKGIKLQDIPQNVIQPGGEGVINTYYLNDKLQIAFKDLESKIQNVKKNEINGKKLWTRIQITTGKKYQHSNFQKCDHIPPSPFNRRRNLQTDVISKLARDHAKIISESPLLSQTYLVEDLDSQQYRTTSEEKYKGDFIYEINRDEIERFFPEQKELYVSVTIIVPPEYFDNLPVQNLYDFDVFYNPAKVIMENHTKNGKNNKHDNTTGFKPKGHSIVSRILIWIGLGLVLAGVAYLALRSYRRYKMVHKNTKEGRMAMTDTMDMDEKVANKSNPGTESFENL